jgi:hypothetical protein
MIERLYTWFRWVIGFNEHLQIVQVIIALSLIYTLCSLPQHVLRLLSLLCLHHSLPGDGSQQCPLFPCSPSYWLTTVSQVIQLVLLIKPQHGLHRKHLPNISTIVAPRCCLTDRLEYTASQINRDTGSRGFEILEHPLSRVINVIGTFSGSLKMACLENLKGSVSPSITKSG